MSLISKQIDDLRAYAKDRKGELAKLVSDAADTIEMLSAKLSAANMERSARYYHGGWIPCGERLPEERGFYLTTTKDKAVYCDYWNEDNFDRTEMVIAWMPLPEPWRGGQG